ncbi:cobyric acid synthase CobQ [Rhizoctonia solani AG-1 IB]|uniref:Cobyric acid synthase CobQ n=1 Tax=Thanatephorus cucumeris (strain AG1-IB / isolate 7/3/14) TaxID=1108050 RepID=A0A0B7G446_THACB|nr:cobyric acid synthase CobQ [Rhizoctonia solani AG-1 IB]
MSEKFAATSIDHGDPILAETDSSGMALAPRPVERGHKAAKLDPGLLVGLEILQQDNDASGFKVVGTKATPIKFLGIVLHGKEDEASGPSFEFSNQISNKICSLTGDINLFGTSLGTICFNYESTSSSFCGTANGAKIDFLLGPIPFELAIKEEGYILRATKLPAVFKNLIEALKLAEKIEKLSEMDGSPCGVIKLALAEGLNTELKVEVIPEVVAGDTSKLQFDIKGSLEITLLERSVKDIEFSQITVTVDISKPLGGLYSTLTESLKTPEFVEKIIQDLWKDKAKLAEVISLLSAEKLTAKAATTLVCRDLYKPKPNKKDPPKEDQKEQTDDDGGPDGDGGAGSGGAGTGVGGAGGGSAISNLIDSLVAGGISLLGAAASKLDHSSGPDSHSGIQEPTRPDGPPPELDDSVGKAINSALLKDFGRWAQCTRLEDAIDSVLECALDYREAIALLRKILRSRNIVKNLGNSVYKDYSQRLSMLIYDFSMLSANFARQWLDMSDYQIAMKAPPSNNESIRRLQISWSRMLLKPNTGVLVTVLIDDKPGPLTFKCIENTDTITIDIPGYSRTKKLNITVLVSTAVVVQGGNPKYTFYSQGKPSIATVKEEPPIVTTLNISNYFPETVSLLGDSMTYTPFRNDTPLILLGSYLHWPVKIHDPDNKYSWGFLSQNVEAPHEYKTTKQSGPIIPNLVDITIDGEWPNTMVSLSSAEQQNITMPLAELLRPEFSLKYRHVRVSHRDASSQPPSDDLSYSKSVLNVKQYPVILFGSVTLWPILFVDQRRALSLQGYDGNKDHLITFGYVFNPPFNSPVEAPLDESFVRINRIEIIRDTSRPEEYGWVEIWGDSNRLLVKIDTQLWNTMDSEIDNGRK